MRTGLEPPTTRWCWRRNRPPETFRAKSRKRPKIGRLCQQTYAKSADEWAPFGRLSERYEKGQTGWWSGQDSNLRQHRYERSEKARIIAHPAMSYGSG